MLPYAGTPTYHVTVRRIEDGEQRNATKLGASTEDLADNSAYFYNVLRNGATPDDGIDVKAFRIRGNGQVDGWFYVDGVFRFTGGNAAFGLTRDTLISQQACRYTPDGDRDYDSFEVINMTGTVERGAGSARTLIASSLNGANRILRLTACPNPFNVTASAGVAQVRYVVHDGTTNALEVQNAVGLAIATLQPGEAARFIQATAWRRAG